MIIFLDLTDPREPIPIDCSARYLGTFIKLVDHYPTLIDDHDAEFEKDLFKNFNDLEISECVKQLAILDSDYLFDSIADVILNRINDMEVEQIQQYLGLQNDFTPAERQLIKEHRLEYIISLNTQPSKLYFPFPAPSFITLENKFYCPLNILLARIIQRSHGSTAFRLSMCNKTLKNESDRHPIKLQNFNEGSTWFVGIYPFANFYFSPETHDAKYFNAIKERKISVEKSINLFYSRRDHKLSGDSHHSSLEFVVPRQLQQTPEISFSGYAEQIFLFDIQRCPFPSIRYNFSVIKLNFADAYKHLIAKDLTKAIKLVF